MLLPAEEIIPGRPLPPECHAEPHTDYDGTAVRWGLTHHKESAADCCQACLDQAKRAKPGQMKCNIWVYCPSEYGCYSPDIYKHKHQECWLKQVVHTGPSGCRYADRSLPGSSAENRPSRSISAVGGRLSEKKGRRRRGGKEEKKKRGEEERIPSARALSSPACYPRSCAFTARGSPSPARRCRPRGERLRRPSYLCCQMQAERPRLSFKDKYSESYRTDHSDAPVLVPWISGVVGA
ncbi:hypothetical protein BHM03_00015073 [Ensete ventricosum]|nr:hypothetical protein BHM03_00015073 [Ensete ventricosum]